MKINTFSKRKFKTPKTSGIKHTTSKIMSSSCRVKLVLKRIFDVVFSLAGLVLVAASVLFRQKRVGLELNIFSKKVKNLLTVEKLFLRCS